MKNYKFISAWGRMLGSFDYYINMQLELLGITRQNILDAQFVCSCDNCGKPIVNIASVKDSEGVIYNIGLDCKKTLIDLPKINEILASDNFMKEYDVKEYKQGLNEITKFLKFCAYPDVEIKIDFMQHITIYDKLESQN